MVAPPFPPIAAGGSPEFGHSETVYNGQGNPKRALEQSRGIRDAEGSGHPWSVSSMDRRVPSFSGKDTRLPGGSNAWLGSDLEGGDEAGISCKIRNPEQNYPRGILIASQKPADEVREGDPHMPQVSRRTFLELASASLICGCSSPGNIGDTAFPVLAFSDIHFDPFFDPDPRIFTELNGADPGQWADVFASSAIKTPSKPGSDTNYPLLVLALESIRENLGASPIILFTGDLLGHGISQQYFKAAGSTDVAAMMAFTDKVVSFVTQEIRAVAGDVPVLFALGNCDSYTGYGPDSYFLANNADAFFTTLLNGATNHEDFISSFTADGYYAAEPTGANVMVIGLNTIMFSPLVQNKDGSENNEAAVDAELSWFDSKLASAKAAGKKVWLLMHAPPGADEGTTAKSVQGNGHIAGATMMWEANYQADFMRVLAKYPGVISLTLAGHTHMDEYRLISGGNVVEIIPGISPIFSNDPAYKIFQLNSSTLTPTDYNSLNYKLAASPKQFAGYYTYSREFPIAESLANSQKGLLNRLATDPNLQSLYREYFYSGNDSANPITEVNWPVYWSGIGMMTEPAIVASVNLYPRGA
jgi:hypothetical protein